jgi:hypothetical protein
MASRDLMNDINPIVAIAPIAVADDATQKSGAIDTKGFESATFALQTGILADTDADWTVVIKDGDTDTQTDHVAVADTFLIGTEALMAFDFADDSITKKIGYIGGKRYISIEIVNGTANSASAPMAVLCILGAPHTRPTTNPPA